MRITVRARSAHPRLSTMQLLNFYSAAPEICGRRIRVGSPVYVDEPLSGEVTALLRSMVNDGYVDLLDEDDRPYLLPSLIKYDPMAPLAPVLTPPAAPEFAPEPEELEELPPLPSPISVLVQRPPEALPGKPVGEGAPEALEPVEWHDPEPAAETAEQELPMSDLEPPPTPEVHTPAMEDAGQGPDFLTEVLPKHVPLEKPRRGGKKKGCIS